MKSYIWKVTAQNIGELEPFNSEYDMEAFLMNNPQIIGCWDPGSETVPRLLRQQLSTVKKTGDRGRIDLVGLVSEDEDYLLKIFELKKGEISEDNVNQLIDYLKGWPKDKSAREEIQSWIEELEVRNIPPKKLEKILNNPKGVIIGTSFSPEAITLANEHGIDGIRLTRFMTNSNEYYVVIEDQIGKIVGSAQRFSWKDLINPKDRLYLKVGERTIWAQPDNETFDNSNKSVIFEKKSRDSLLKNKDKIRKNAFEPWMKKTVEQAFRDLNASNVVSLTGATCLGFLAFKGKTKAFINPANYWKLERTDETISQLQSKIKNK